MSLEHRPSKEGKNQSLNTQPSKLHSTDEACEVLGVGKTFLYALMKNNHLRAIKIGRLTKIPDSSIREFIENAPAYQEV